MLISFVAAWSSGFSYQHFSLMQVPLNARYRLCCSFTRVITNNVIDFFIRFFNRTIFDTVEVTSSQMVFHESIHLLDHSAAFVKTFEGVMVLHIPNM